ncbi:FAD binding domain-containing protein [Chloroflexota bacterium]
MKKFTHINARTVDGAVLTLNQHGREARAIAGGTDLLGTLKAEIFPEYPQVIVTLKSIPGLDFIKEEGEILRIGALTRLEDIASNTIIRSKYTALAEAAHRTATPLIRKMGTIGGNICQFNRCWYYRASHNYFHCVRKGGKTCQAITGDHRYHSIFGAVQKCVAVNPSDTAPALVALDARIKTSRRTIDIGDFFSANGEKSTILDTDEIVTEIQVPTPDSYTKSTFIKFALRQSIDFPVVNCAVMIKNGEGTIRAARICLNAVYNQPYRATAAEESIIGKTISASTAEGASRVAVASASPMPENRYKVEIARVLVKRSILALRKR